MNVVGHVVTYGNGFSGRRRIQSEIYTAAFAGADPCCLPAASRRRPLVLLVRGMLRDVNLVSAKRGGARKGVDELGLEPERQCQRGVDG